MGVCSSQESPKKTDTASSDNIYVEPSTAGLCTDWIKKEVQKSREQTKEDLNHFFPQEKFSTPDHKELFPKQDDECNRLLKAFRNGLFITELPLRSLEKFMDEYIADLDKRNFAYKGVYVTAWGYEQYRLLSYRVRSPQNGTVLQPGNSPEVQEYGYTQLSACQYVVSASEPRIFSSAGLPPILNFVADEKNEERLQEIARDKTLSHDDVWPTMGQYCIDKQKMQDGKIDPVNMMQQCWGQSLDYVGAPIWVNESVAGVICVLHTEDNKDPDEWIEESRVQDASERISNLFSKMEHLHTSQRKFDLLFNRDLRHLYCTNQNDSSEKTDISEDDVIKGKNLNKELAQYFDQPRPSTTLTTTYNGRDVQYSVNNPLFNPAFDLEESLTS